MTNPKPISEHGVPQEPHSKAVLDAAQQSLKKQVESGPVDRQTLREKQKEETKEIKKRRHDLLRCNLPAYVFAVNPKIKKFTDGSDEAKAAGVPPNILEQEVARAQASAELNVYLSYLNNNEKKIEFLQKWEKAAEDVYSLEDNSISMMNGIKKKVWIDFNKPRHPEGTKKAHKPWYYVHDFEPLYRPHQNPGTTPLSANTTRLNSTAGLKPSFNTPDYLNMEALASGLDKVARASDSSKSTSPKSISPKSATAKDKKVGVKKDN